VIARRAAAELRDGQLVNLASVADTNTGYVAPEIKIWIHSENGIVGIVGWRLRIDRYGADRCGGCLRDVRPAGRWSIVRRHSDHSPGLLDVTFLGAMEVSQHGDLANWMIPGKFAAGIGGGAELAQKADGNRDMPHTDKDGNGKSLRTARYRSLLDAVCRRSSPSMRYSILV